MPIASTDNVAGHRAKYDILSSTRPAAEVGAIYVGGADPILVGFHELETIRSYATLENAVIVDIGCGIGRLTQHLIDEPIGRYVGLDIIQEIMQEAEQKAAGDSRFQFGLSEECCIPLADASADIVVAFSLITHLLDEEVFEYFLEASRVLRPGATAIFSFVDFHHPAHQDLFFKHAVQFRHGHGDLLKFTTQDVLTLFSKRAGFRSESFIDGSSMMPCSRRPSKLLDVTTLPLTYPAGAGQSLCIMKK